MNVYEILKIFLLPVKQLTIWIWNGLKRLKGFSAKKPDKELMLRSNFFVKDKDFVKEISYMKIVKRQL